MKTLFSQNSLVFNPPMLGCVLFLSGLPGSGSKIYDRSPYGNIGTITGATWKRLPSGLWYLYFDGTDDYVTITFPSAISFGDLTIEIWVYPSTPTGSQPYVGIADDLSKIEPNTNDQVLNFAVWGGKWHTNMKDGGAWQGALETATPTPDSAWHLYALTGIVGKSRILYLDGVEIASDATFTTLGSMEGLRVGGEMFGEDSNSQIALLRIYNYGRSALQIQKSFNREKHLFGVW